MSFKYFWGLIYNILVYSLIVSHTYSMEAIKLFKYVFTDSILWNKLVVQPIFNKYRSLSLQVELIIGTFNFELN